MTIQNKHNRNMNKKRLSYETAMQELESIVDKVETGEMDIDNLSDSLRRAKELLTFCRERLTKVDDEIQKIFGDEAEISVSEGE